MQKTKACGYDYVNVMAEVTFEDPDEYRDTVPVDDRGRVVIGKQHAGKRVRIAVEVQNDE